MTWKTQVSIPYFTGIATDVVTNDFHFEKTTPGAPTPTDYTNLENDLVAFYNTCYTTGGSGLQMAPWMRPSLTRFRTYDLLDPTPRIPRRDSTIALTPTVAASSAVPTETAIVISMQADRTSGIPQARRRGRIFLGGLGIAASSGTASVFPEVNVSVRGALGTACIALNSALSGHGWDWVVLSRTMAASYSITNGWVDNALDTQRRRGQGATARTVW